MARGLGSRGIILCSQFKGADQLQAFCTADLRLFLAYAKNRFSHDSARLINMQISLHALTV